MKKQIIPFIAASLTAVCALLPSGALLAAPSFGIATSGDVMLNIADFTVATYESGLTIMNIGNAGRTGDVFSFPVVGGAVDAGSILLETEAGGGMRITNGKDFVTLSEPIVNTTEEQPIMTFLVTINGTLKGRYEMFNLKVPNYAKPQALSPGDTFKAANIVARLSEVGANTLNSALGTTFITNLNVGSVKIKTVVGAKLPG